MLLGPSLGFEVLRSGLEGEMRMYQENRGGLVTVPLNPGYCRAYVHARKVRQLASDAFIWPLVVARSKDLWVAQVGIAALRDPQITFCELVVTASVLTLTPGLILFFTLQRFIVRGIATTGIRG